LKVSALGLSYVHSPAMLSTLALLWLLDTPTVAARVAMTEQGLALDMRDGRRTVLEGLARICQRESRCKTHPGISANVGIHVRDAASSRRVWRKMVRRKALDPACQPYGPGEWATRGSWGLMAALHARWMPECYQAAEFDSPLVSARVAVAKYLEQCEPEPRPRRGWCKGT
jgi:hypothetical protein